MLRRHVIRLILLLVLEEEHLRLLGEANLLLLEEDILFSTRRRGHGRDNCLRLNGEKLIGKVTF